MAERKADRFRLLGVWWRPEQGRGRSVGGKLGWVSGFALRLHWIGIEEALPPGGSYPVVLGQTEDGQLWTLEEVGRLSPRWGQFADDRIVSEFGEVTVGFAGAHLPEEAQRRFRTVRCSFSQLPEWIDEEPFAFDPVEDAPADHEYVLRYRPVENIEIRVGRMEIVIERGMALPHRGRTRAGFSQWLGVRLQADEALPVFDWVEYCLGPLQNLVTLGTGVPTILLSPSAEVEASGGERARMVMLYFRPPYGRITVPKSFGPQRLFAFADVRARWAEVCGRWLALYRDEDLRRVLDLYFGAQYGHRQYAESQFQGLAEAAEAYHRKRIGDDEKQVVEHEERRARVLAQIPDEDRGWADRHLRGRPEPNLRTRLLQLIERERRSMELVIRDPQQFAELVERRRNELAHRGPRRWRLPPGERLYDLSRQLTFLLQACFLRELGFEDAIPGLMRNNSRYSYVAGK